MKGAGYCASKDDNPLPPDDVAGKEHWLEQAEVSIYLWEKFVADPTGKPVVVLAHGSATAGRESFDLQVPGKPSYSLMDHMARQGFDVFAPDIRGWGRSSRPEGHVSTQDAYDDLNAVVDHIIRLREVRKVHLLGWSWGTQYAGMLVMSHPGKVARYVSYAQMRVDSPDIASRRPKIEFFRKNPYITIPEQGWKRRFYSMTPDSVNDPQVVDTFAKVACQVETKTPTGPQLDMVSIMPLIHARLVPVPTMIIHGEYDDVADLQGLFSFFRELPNPDKKYVVVPRAGHMMHLQEGHKRFQYEVINFFKADLQ